MAAVEVVRLTNQLSQVLSEHVERKERIHGDGSLSETQRAYYLEQEHKKAYQQARWFTSRLCGEWVSPSEPLGPGAISKALTWASERIRKATGASDASKGASFWAQLEHEVARVPGVIGDLVNMQGVEGYYETASDIQRRALATAGPPLLRARFGSDVSLGGFLARMRADVREAASPALQNALDMELADKQDCGSAFGVVERAKMVLEDSSPFVSVGVIGKTLGRWVYFYRFEDASKLDSPAVWQFSQRMPSSVALGTEWPGGVS